MTMRAIVKDVPVGTYGFVDAMRPNIGKTIEVAPYRNGFSQIDDRFRWFYYPEWLEFQPTREERLTAVLRQIAECDSLDEAHQLAQKALEE